ncbi:MAG TPA: hypothetical protein VFI25_02710 [Planctomycetota bacterium]|nr:hypothetical protein [Planctomycetota bacterium]
MSTSLSDFFDIDFARNLVAGVVGVFLGALSALRVERTIDLRKQRQETAALVTLLNEGVGRNLDQLQKLQARIGAEAKKVSLPIATLDTEHFDTTVIERGRLLAHRPGLSRAINVLAGECAHLNRTLERLWELYFGEAWSTPAFIPIREALLASTRRHVASSLPVARAAARILRAARGRA